MAFAWVQRSDGPQGKTEFAFLEINREWEKLTGARMDAVRNMGVANAFPELEASGADWRGLFLRAQAARQELSWQDRFTGRSYRMAVVPAGDRRLAVFLEKMPTAREELLWAALHAVHDGVLVTDGQGRVTGINRTAQELTGWDETEALGRPSAEVLPLRGKDGDPLQQVLRDGGTAPLSSRTVLTDRHGRGIPVSGILSAPPAEGGRVFGAVVVFRNATKEREQRDAIVYLSYHDHLTGLYNRRFADEEIHRLDVPRQLPLAVIMGDVNGLKISNDVFGHEVGDQILQKAAGAIRASCREEDIVSRWGGDEFLVLLPHTDAATAEGIIRRIRGRCARCRVGDMQLSISLGCAAKGQGTENFRRILQVAEEKMYHQKLMEGHSYRSGVIRGLLAALPEKSCESDAHVQRLKRSCAAMARQVGLSQDAVSDLTTLAMLHDVGQVGVPREVLCKPGPLDAEEWVEVRRHPEIGYRIAHSTMELSVVAESILCHHEHWDGRGYPRGLSKDSIPLVSRIFAVADAYDAMTHDRPYRRAMGGQKAIQELRRCAGTQFDPELVWVFCRLYDRHPANRPPM